MNSLPRVVTRPFTWSNSSRRRTATLSTGKRVQVAGSRGLDVAGRAWTLQDKNFSRFILNPDATNVHPRTSL
ncbi:hypothetical protein E2C01_096214 [Portunus trituberculatus]|uniref:Uncharacterized protein n=1 Tax=Portunus trituberculatus TaxID=210409 RepID=A0A5B7JV16_PORTR|nr:hypothetical protein [Portunus trituberculatus]